MNQELDIFKRALVNAKKLVLESQNSIVKNQDNIQTQADILSEKSIIATLEQGGISCMLYSEELEKPRQLGSGGYEIILDPFDGSYMFLHGIRAFNSIAMLVLEERKVKYALVQSIANDALYCCDSANAFLNDKKIECLTKNVDAPYFITGYAAKKKMLDKVSNLRQLSSDFYFLGDGGPLFSAMVASNNIDVAIEFLPTPLHEFAGAFIAQKAGAWVETLEGRPISTDPLVQQTLVTSRSEKLLRDIQNVFNG